MGNVLETHLLPLAVPVRVPHELDALDAQEVLTVDARLCHGGSAILDESNDVYSLRDHFRVDDEIDLGVQLMVGLSTVDIPLVELCRPTACPVDADLAALGVSRHVESVTVLKGPTLCLIVHWTLMSAPFVVGGTDLIRTSDRTCMKR